MHKFLVGIGVVAVTAMLSASTALAASYQHSTTAKGQPIQLAKDDAKATGAEQPPAKKKHKRSKKSHSKDAAQGAPAEK
jgi:hypothetical protein